jgi:hypothetical protein
MSSYKTNATAIHKLVNIKQIAMLAYSELDRNMGNALRTPAISKKCMRYNEYELSPRYEHPWRKRGRALHLSLKTAPAIRSPLGTPQIRVEGHL